MGLFDLFRRAAPQPQPQPQPRPQPVAAAGNVRFHSDRSRYFDLDRTNRLQHLLTVSRDQRNDAWNDAFLDAAWTASLELPHAKAYTGPDGFPYLRLDLPHPGPFESQCLANLAGDCLAAGVGAAIFASPDDPPESAQYVFSMGLLDSLLRFDSAAGDPLDLDTGPAQDGGAIDFTQPLRRESLVVEQARQVLLGTPSRDYLPACAAAALHRHLEQVWGLKDPRVQLMVDTTLRPHRNLVVGRSRSGFPPDAPIDEMAAALTWYLPPSRAIVLMPEGWDARSMTPLRQLF